MKKLLLASVAISGLALAAAPARADIDLEIGGYFKGYGAFVDQDETTGTDVNSFDMVRDTEIHLGGETTLDNGLTVGAHFELDADGGDNSTTDESYVYFSGDWGRVNVGTESGAGYLLQVAAPSADSNVDGIVQYVSAFANQGGLTTAATALDYNMADSGKTDKITYLSPVMNGFQFGASYTPDLADSSDSLGVGTATAGEADDAYEAALRYEGEFENVGVIAGIGYSSVEKSTSKEQKAWNVGLDLDVQAFGIGAVYMENNQGASDSDLETIVVGADYTTGPFKLGASYLNQDNESTAVEVDRYTGGVVYEYGPGMSFRGSVQFLDQDDADGTAVLLGTQINF